ncbi:MAG TPA: NAD-dependent epimerase/dehydratase family protein [Planctomycetota bacterium]
MRPAPGRAPLGGRATRVALVGTGYIAETHLEALREVPEVVVVALCDVALERARAAARRHGIGVAVAQLQELVPHAIDVVHLCVPPDLHAELARAALELGFSLLVEKPLALEGETAAELFALARARGLVLGANHNSTFHPAFRALVARLGAIGRIEHADVRLAVPLRQLDARDFSHWMFREPRNIVLEQGVHPFAQLVRLLGRPLEVEPTVLATRELGPGQPFHERWSIGARCERGTATLHFHFGATFQQSTLAVRGSDGVLEADLHRDGLVEETKSPWLDAFDAYLAGARRARALGRAARRNLLQYLRQTLRLAPRGDAFYAGMRASIRAFHAAYRAGAEPPGAADEVAGVLAWCAATTRRLPATPRPAALPLDQRPARTGEVLVTGATGFIGRATLRALLARGLSVTALVRRPPALPEDLARAARAGELRLVRAELAGGETLRSALRGARVVLHLATGGGATWEELERAMLGGSRALYEAARAERVERFVYVSSTAALYLGPDCGRAVVDDGDGPDPRPAARALYARGKILTERALTELARSGAPALTIVRPGVVLGAEAPFQHSGLGLWVRDNHCVGWGRGERPLPLVLVEDVADALARVATHAGRELDGRALNLAARAPLGARALVEHVARHTGRALRFHPRPLALSQAMEIGKWLVKKAGGRRDPFPSWRDLKSRSLWPELACRTAREVLGWKPCEDPAQLLARLFPGARP